jgi:hypothetical protein
MVEGKHLPEYAAPYPRRQWAYSSQMEIKPSDDQCGHTDRNWPSEQSAFDFSVLFEFLFFCYLLQKRIHFFVAIKHPRAIFHVKIYFVSNISTIIYMFIIRGFMWWMTRQHCVHIFFSQWPLQGPWTLLQFRNHIYPIGRTPWTSDKSVARPLPIHKTKRIHTSMPLRGFESTIQASEDSSCLRPRGHCVRHTCIYYYYYKKK